MEIGNSPWRVQPAGDFHHWNEGSIICSDALDFLGSLRSDIADIVFLDPPFNLGKKYGEREEDADLLTKPDYLEFIHQVLDESIRIVNPGGALYLYHIPQWAIRLGSYLDKRMTFRHWIAVSMKSNFARGHFLYPAHYALLYFTKGEPRIFNRPKISPLTCRHCGNYVRDYGGYVQYVEDGVNLSDIWEDLSPVRHSNKKHGSSNELPLSLTQRIVQISGQEDGLLVDPFVGTGTSIIAAVEIGMRFLACDRESSCCDISTQRVTEFLSLLVQKAKKFYRTPKKPKSQPPKNI